MDLTESPAGGERKSTGSLKESYNGAVQRRESLNNVQRFFFALGARFDTFLSSTIDRRDKSRDFVPRWLFVDDITRAARHGCSLAPLAYYGPGVFAYPEIALGFFETAGENAVEEGDEDEEENGRCIPQNQFVGE